MGEASVGRVLVASLHQAIADLLPTRLEFYENWLSSEGLREGTIGLAPLHAVLSFLRQEGEPYQLITRRAGEYAAEWIVDAMPSYERTLVAAMPPAVRAQLLLRVSRRLVRSSYTGSRAISRLRKGTAQVDVRASVFCSVREPVPQPLCGFYAAAFSKLHEQFDLPARIDVVDCRGTGASSCVIRVVLASPVEPAGTP